MKGYKIKEIPDFEVIHRQHNVDESSPTIGDEEEDSNAGASPG